MNRARICAGGVALTMLCLLARPFEARATAPAVTGRMVVDRALTYLHDDYALTGSNPKTGFSCIGFVWYVFQGLGVNMPGNLTTAIETYPRVPEMDLKPGDIIFFKNTWWRGVSHVGIYIGHGKMISAENFRRGVNISALRDDPVEGSYWQRHFMAAERPVGPVAIVYGRVAEPHLTVSFRLLNLRAGPSLQSSVETVLQRGTDLRLVGSRAGWDHVRLMSGLSGWVVQYAVTGSDWVQHRRNYERLRWILPGVNIHTGPAVTDSVLAVTYPGLHVRVLKRSGEFSHIHTTTGLSGWVLSRFLGRTSPLASWSTSDAQRRHPRGLLTITAHIRTGPSLSASIIRWVPAGTRVTILNRLPLWDHVRVTKRLRGYIYAPFITA